MKYRTIILDRDGVINEVRKKYVRNVQQLTFIPGSIYAIKKLLQNNKNLVIVSNQAGVGKGLIGEDDLLKINLTINKAVNRELEYLYCKHKKEDRCNCRKPQPGLLNIVKKKYPGPYVFVGDNITDLSAAKSAQIISILVRTGHGEECSKNVMKGQMIFASLFESLNELLTCQ